MPKRVDQLERILLKRVTQHTSQFYNRYGGSVVTRIRCPNSDLGAPVAPDIGLSSAGHSSPVHGEGQ